jgi:hypothetical protein
MEKTIETASALAPLVSSSAGARHPMPAKPLALCPNQKGRFPKTVG